MIFNHHSTIDFTRHPGNIACRNFVASFMTDYRNFTLSERQMKWSSTYCFIQKQNGRFLQSHHSDSEFFVEISRNEALTKISQLCRNKKRKWICKQNNPEPQSSSQPPSAPSVPTVLSELCGVTDTKLDSVLKDSTTRNLLRQQISSFSKKMKKIVSKSKSMQTAQTGTPISPQPNVNAKDDSVNNQITNIFRSFTDKPTDIPSSQSLLTSAQPPAEKKGFCFTTMM